MRLILIFPIIALVSIVVAFVGLEYLEKLELEQLIISCMKQLAITISGGFIIMNFLMPHCKDVMC